MADADGAPVPTAAALGRDELLHDATPAALAIASTPVSMDSPSDFERMKQAALASVPTKKKQRHVVLPSVS